MTRRLALTPDTVEMPRDLALALLDLVSYPPKKHAAYTHAAAIPWRRVDEVRSILDDLGFDWQRTHDLIHEERP